LNPRGLETRHASVLTASPKEFERNPSAAVRGKLGGHLSDEQIKKIIKLVKSKLESEGHSRKSSGDMLTALYEIGKLPD